MRFYIKTKNNEQSTLLAKISKLQKPKITKTTRFTDNTIIIKTEPISYDQNESLETIIKQLKKLPNVESVSTGPVYKEKNELSENIQSRQCHFFFDIDSTLTRYKTGTINRKIKSLFHDMSDNNYFLYLVSGRAHTKIMEDIKHLEYVEKYAIAENGGIILHGFTSESIQRFGSKEGPSKVWKYLISQNKNIKQDKSQGVRITEIIVLHSNTLKTKDIENAIEKTTANAQVLSSKTSFHISKKGIDKGSAMEELSTFLDLGNDLTIAVGDSQLDIPMFNAADKGFAPSNASDEIKNMTSNQPTIMSKPNFEGVTEMYEKYFKK